jgi:hypothetical protein
LSKVDHLSLGILTVISTLNNKRKKIFFILNDKKSEDTKGAIRIDCKSKKNRQHKWPKEKVQKDKLINKTYI